MWMVAAYRWTHSLSCLTWSQGWYGLTEIAGLDIDGRVKKRGWTLQDWTMADRTLTDGYLCHQKSNNKVHESFAHIEFNAK